MPLITRLVHALGYDIPGLVAWQRVGRVWILDLGLHHGQAPHRLRFGPPGEDALDFVVPGSGDMEPDDALLAALDVVTWPAGVAFGPAPDALTEASAS